MDKHNKRHQQHTRYEDFLNNKGSSTFNARDHDAALCATFVHLLYIQFFYCFYTAPLYLMNLRLDAKRRKPRVITRHLMRRFDTSFLVISFSRFTVRSGARSTIVRDPRTSALEYILPTWQRLLEDKKEPVSHQHKLLPQPSTSSILTPSQYPVNSLRLAGRKPWM